MIFVIHIRQLLNLLKRELCNAVTKSKDLELICIDSIKEEAELYNLDP